MTLCLLMTQSGHELLRPCRFRRIQVYAKDLEALPGHPEPAVSWHSGNPVAMGLVASLNRPGGNATGVSFRNVELVAKRLGMLRELAPVANRFAALVNPNAAFIDAIVEELRTSASTLGLSIEILRAGAGREIDAAFANLAQKPGVALLVGP